MMLAPAGPRPEDTILAVRDVDECSLRSTLRGGVVEGKFQVGRWSTTWYGGLYRANAKTAVRILGGVAWETQGALYLAVPSRFVRKASRIMEG